MEHVSNRLVKSANDILIPVFDDTSYRTNYEIDPNKIYAIVADKNTCNSIKQDILQVVENKLVAGIVLLDIDKADFININPDNLSILRVTKEENIDTLLDMWKLWQLEKRAGDLIVIDRETGDIITFITKIYSAEKEENK